MNGIHLEVKPPFHFEATVRVLQRRPTDAIDRWVDGAYLRLHCTDEGPVLGSVENRGSIDRPDLRLSFPIGKPSPRLRRRLVATTRRILGLDVDPSPAERMARKVSGLREVVAGLRGLRPPRFPGLFEAIGRVVPYQQISLDAGTAITDRFVERYGPSVEWLGETWYAFPTPDSLRSATEEDLRAVGLSHAKGHALLEAAKRIAAGELSREKLEKLPTQEIAERLVALPGLGPWSASLILLRGFGRLDAFPGQDKGVTNSLAMELHVDPHGLDASKFAETFGDVRGMLYFYGLGGRLLASGTITPARARRRVGKELHEGARARPR